MSSSYDNGCEDQIDQVINSLAIFVVKNQTCEFPCLQPILEDLLKAYYFSLEKFMESFGRGNLDHVGAWKKGGDLVTPHFTTRDTR